MLPDGFYIILIKNKLKRLKNKIYLGHDESKHLIDIGWLHKRRDSLWIHCKDLITLSKFNTYYNYLNYFFHESDLGVLTSHHYIWSTNNINNGINNDYLWCILMQCRFID